MKFDFDTEDPFAARLGLIVLQADETLESEFRQLRTEKPVAVYHSRVKSAPEVTTQTLAQMEQDLPAASGLLPAPVSFDAVGYGCTSGTSVIGSARIAELVRQGCKADHVTDPLTALVAACRFLGISRLAFLSPYIESVSATLRQSLEAQGLQFPVFGSFEEGEETTVARIDGASVRAAVKTLCADAPVDAVFLSCTNLRTFDIIGPLEQEIGVPVLSSNQVLGWHLHKLAGIEVTGPGKLFTK